MESDAFNFLASYILLSLSICCVFFATHRHALAFAYLALVQLYMLQWSKASVWDSI